VQSLESFAGIRCRRARIRRPWPAWRQLPPASPAGTALLEQPFLWMRWGALTLGLIFAFAGHDGARALVAGGFLLAYTLWRTWRPIGFDRSGARPNMALLVELALGLAVVEATGFGHSPFLVSLGVATAVAGFAGGVRVVLGLAGIAGLAVVVSTAILATHRQLTPTSAQFAIELVLVGVVGGLSRYLVVDAQAARAGLDAHITHLSEVNDLLLDLHSATLSESTPLDLDGAARWALERLEDYFAPEVAAVVLRDPVTGHWRLAAEKSDSSPDRGRHFELPADLALAVEGSEPVAHDDLRSGLSYKSRWGLYCPLRARGELLGVLAVESHSHRHTSREDRRRLGDLAGAVALAVDNAGWLDRIHTLGIEKERSRLARELHDHVGQFVVYLGLEVDRLIDLNEGRAVQGDLRTLRGDLRELVQELRDALVDLRSDVTENQGVDAVLASFVEQVNARNAAVTVTLVADSSKRLPLSVEREFSRVAREAVTNAERHARASKISVLWRCREEDGALLEVSDDGTGMAGSGRARASAYGLVGMRERADSVRAKLEIYSRSGEGTVVRMRKAVS
jgi:signal transduction histidine kinase